MTRSPQELAQTVREALRDPMRLSWEGRSESAKDALADLVALAEAGERALEALTELANEQHWEVGAPYQTDGRYRFITPSWSPFSTPWAFAHDALGEQP